MERRRLEKAEAQKQYYKDLQKGIDDKKRNQHLEKMMHDNDAGVMQFKKQETDFIQRGLQDRQKEEKLMLGQIYQNQIDQSRKLKQNEVQLEKELEKMQIERVKAIDPEAFNKLKKKAYQQEFKQDLDQKTKFKQYDQVMREHSVRESKKLMDEYAKKEMMNEQNYKNKFSKFDEGLQKRMSDYNSYVMKPTLEKQSNLSQIEQKNIQEYNRKLAEDERRQEEARKMQLLTTHNVIKTQMHEKNKMKKLGDELGQIEVQKTSDRIYEINSFDQMLKEDKKKRQEMYRQMLQSQIQYNNGLRAFGNMTKVEKQLNKDDLKAYKIYDNKQYALIPGINNEKRFLKRDEPKKVRGDTYADDQKRLEGYGYGRFLKKVPTAGPIDNYGAAMNHSRQEANEFANMNRSYSGSNPGNLNVDNQSQAPNSRRHNQSSPRVQGVSALRNAGAISMTQDGIGNRPAGSPSGNPYRHQVL